MNNAGMDPRRLELLLELSRLGSMRAVAETMHITTSTVSQQLAVLAREAGTPLIEPAGRQVRLTPAGRRLAGHAVTILAALEAARLDLDPSAAPSGIVRAASYATAARRVLLPAARILAAHHPEVSLHIHEHEPAEALSLLASDDIDLALIYDYNLAPAASTAAWSSARSAAPGGVSGCRPSPAGDAGPRPRSSTGSVTTTGSSTHATPPTTKCSASSVRWPDSSPGSRIGRTASSWSRT